MTVRGVRSGPDLLGNFPRYFQAGYTGLSDYFIAFYLDPFIAFVFSCHSQKVDVFFLGS